MKNLQRLYFSMFIVLMLLAGLAYTTWKNLVSADAVGAQVAIYVAQDGDDKYSGRYAQVNDDKTDGPVKTITRAQQLLRQLKNLDKDKQYSIQLRSGEYLQTSTINLSSDDSGKDTSNPTVIESYSGETASIVGALRSNLDWQSCGSECKSKGVYKAYLPERSKINTLFVNGSRAQKARTPNDTGSYEQRHYFFGEKIVDPVYKTDGSVDTLSPQCSSYFYFQPGQIDPTWKNIKDVEIVYRNLYLEYRDQIKSVDPTTNKVYFMPQLSSSPNKKYCYNGGFTQKGSRFYAENVFEALDFEGEYYFDSSTKWLYYLPKAGEDIKNIDVRIPSVNSLVQVGSESNTGSGPKNVEIKNLKLSYTDHDVYPADIKDSKPSMGIYFAENITLQNLEIQNVAGSGVYVNSASKNIKIKNNEISNIGLNGIKVSAKGEAAFKYDESKGIYIENNKIHDIGYDSSLMVHPISMLNSGYAKVAHNTIYNAPYSGISKQQAIEADKSDRYKVDIEFNEIYNVMQKLNDGGGIHLCSKFSQTAAIRNNYIHDLTTTDWNIPNVNNLSGIYYDCAGIPTNADSYNNLIKNAPLGITLINQGANKLYNNILIDVAGNSAQGPMHIGLCCSANAACAKDKSAYGFTLSPNEFYRNIFYYTIGAGDSSNPTRPIYLNSDCGYGLQKDVLSKMIKQRDWNLYFDYSKTETSHPSIYVNNGGPKLRQWSWLENLWSNNGITNFENNSIFADPQFENPQGGDYRLKSTSPAISKLGFVPFDFSEAGVKESFGPESAARKILNIHGGFNALGSALQILPDADAKKMYLYTFDKNTQTWLIAKNPASAQINPSVGYYIYNPSSFTSIGAIVKNEVSRPHELKKGWNMLSSTENLSFGNLSFSVNGEIRTAKNLIDSKAIYEKIFIITNDKASSSCDYYSILSDNSASSSCAKSKTGFATFSEIISGTPFWVYLK